MPQSFDSHNPPFDRLSHDEINELRAALDIGYFRPGEVIVERNSGSGPAQATKLKTVTAKTT